MKWKSGDTRRMLADNAVDRRARNGKGANRPKRGANRPIGFHRHGRAPLGLCASNPVREVLKKPSLPRKTGRSVVTGTSCCEPDPSLSARSSQRIWVSREGETHPAQSRRQRDRATITPRRTARLPNNRTARLSRNDAIAGGGARPPGGLRRPETKETRPEVGFHQLLPRFARGESVRTA